MSKQITSRDLRDKGWLPGPALGKALKIANRLVENGTDVEAVLTMFDDLLKRPSAYLIHDTFSEIANQLLQKKPPKRGDTVIGRCQICRQIGPLSFEHVPPQAAMNDATVISYTVESYFAGEKKKVDIQQGGMGRHTLCESCNNNTGAWYAGEYANWAKTGYDILRHTGLEPREIFVTFKDVYPLRFLKQVVTCFFSVNGIHPDATFAENHPQLVEFVLNKHQMELSDYYQFYLRLDVSQSMRRSLLSGLINLNFAKDQAGRIQQIRPRDYSVFSEITHIPFALIMTEDSTFSDATKITGCKRYGYDECVDFKIPLKIGSSTKPIPGYYGGPS